MPKQDRDGKLSKRGIRYCLLNTNRDWYFLSNKGPSVIPRIQPRYVGHVDSARSQVLTSVQPRVAPAAPTYTWESPRSALQGLNVLICEVLIPSAGAIVVLVDHSGDELRGEGDDHSIGNDCQHSNGFQYLQPGP